MPAYDDIILVEIETCQTYRYKTRSTENTGQRTTNYGTCPWLSEFILVRLFWIHIWQTGSTNRYQRKGAGKRTKEPETEAIVWQDSVRRKAMLERLKTQLFSEDGMKVVNVLFILLYLVRNPLFTICAYTVWFVYLVYSVRNTKSKGMKIFYSVLSVFAMISVLLNAYFTFIVHNWLNTTWLVLKWCDFESENNMIDARFGMTRQENAWSSLLCYLG